MECFAGRWHRLLSYVHMVPLAAAKRPPLSGACKLLRKRKTFQDLARWDWPALKNMRMNCNPNKYNWFFLLSPENKSSHRRSAVKTKSAPPVNLKSDRAVQNKNISSPVATIFTDFPLFTVKIFAFLLFHGSPVTICFMQWRLLCTHRQQQFVVVVAFFLFSSRKINANILENYQEQNANCSEPIIFIPPCNGDIFRHFGHCATLMVWKYL